MIKDKTTNFIIVLLLVLLVVLLYYVTDGKLLWWMDGNQAGEQGGFLDGITKGLDSVGDGIAKMFRQMRP